MPRFKQVRGGMRIQLEGDEAEILRRLIAEMELLLQAEIPNDPVNQRLFPQAYLDPSDNDKYNELTGEELRNTKKQAAQRVSDALGVRGGFKGTIPEEEVDAWLTLLTDLRLAIGTRLGVTEDDMSADAEADSPDAQAYAVMHWLGWLQESLLNELIDIGDNPHGEA